tara:strand:+ start:184 stop:561 length:378 start_codon:yes stop_codon:yes gene_type:complete
MATVTPTLTLVSADALVDKLNLTVTNSLTITGDAIYGSAVMATGSDFTLSPKGSPVNTYVYMKNMSTDNTAKTGSAENIDVELGSVNVALLGPGEFLFLPWTGETALNMRSTSSTPTLEYAIFEL